MKMKMNKKRIHVGECFGRGTTFCGMPWDVNDPRYGGWNEISDVVNPKALTTGYCKECLEITLEKVAEQFRANLKVIYDRIEQSKTVDRNELGKRDYK